MNSIPIVIISVVLFFVLFFGIGFILNMLFRKSWVMAILYPFVALYYINSIPINHYLTEPSVAFAPLWSNIVTLPIGDIVILVSGLVGAFCSGFVMKILRNNGYQMF